MSSLIDAVNESRKRASARNATPSGNIILRPTKFTDKTVIGVVLTGPAEGKEIEVLVPDNGNRTVNVKKMTTRSNATTSSFVDIENGGTIRIERLKEGKDGVYTAKWINVFDGRPNEGSQIVHDVMVELRNKVSKVAGVPDEMSLHAIYPDLAKTASNMAELEECLAEAFDEKGGACLFIREPDRIGSIPYGLGGTKTEDGWIRHDPKARAAEVIAEFGDRRAEIEAGMQSSPFTVVPSSLMKIGQTTALEIQSAIKEAREKGEDARISTIEPGRFALRSIGTRVVYALNANPETSGLPKDAGERLRARFLETAEEKVKEAFLASKGTGWVGVSNEDMRRFFESQGVTLKSYPENGWTKQSVLLKYNVATKIFGQNDAVPFPPLDICQDAIKAFNTEIRDAILAVVEAPVKKAAAEAPKQEEPKAAPAPAAADLDDLDALLDGVEDADMAV